VKAANPINVWKFFVKEETRSSALLISAALFGLILANSRFSELYFQTLDHNLTLGIITQDIQHWINEGLMVFFFLVVTLEVKREVIDGELKGWKKASFPVYAALGGMVFPALIYTLINPTPPTSQGWAIPMATDIAIAVGVIGLLGSKIPKQLRIFLLTLAIVDDIGSILIIGVFYSQPDNVFALSLAITTLIAMAILRKRRFWPLLFIILGFIVWYLMLVSGVPGTIAGVLIGLLMPLTTRRKGSNKLQKSEMVEEVLLPFTSFFVVPLFVLANSGIKITFQALDSEPSFRVFIGVVLGLLVGKSLGIFLAARLASTLKLAQKPSIISWKQIIGVGFIAGIGFTISLLVTGLAFSEFSELKNSATAAVFVASIISGSIGLTILSKTSSK
jgi:NhaA family Na+:H+ antiporter